MLQLYPLNFLHREIPGKSVDSKLQRRGERPLAPTRDTNERRSGISNRKIFRDIFVVLSVTLSSLAFAHQGFNVVLDDASVDVYTVTILEDTHLANEQPQMNLMIQLANGREAAPENTQVKLRLEQNSKIIYEDQVKYVGSSSSDGRKFYAYYIAQIPLTELGSYDMRLELNSSLGTAETTLNFQPKLAPEFRVTELIPSLLVLGICLAGAAMFVVSSRQPAQKEPVQKEPTQKGLHHA